MGRSIPGTLTTHITEDVTSLAMCWKITRTDGQVFAYTEFDQDLTEDGTLYKSLNSGLASAIKTTNDGSLDNLETRMILDDDGITEDDLRLGLFDGADVEIFFVNYNDVAAGKVKLVKGNLGQVVMGDSNARVELLGLNHRLQTVLGRIYTDTCDADFCDARCGLTAAEYTDTGSVASSADYRNFVGDTIEAEDFYKYGVVTFTSGLNSGFSREVKSSGAAGQFEFFFPFPYEIQAGDAYSVIQGCDQSESTCKNTFNNLINFRGCPDIPGRDKAMGYPDVKY